MTQPVVADVQAPAVLSIGSDEYAALVAQTLPLYPDLQEVVDKLQEASTQLSKAGDAGALARLLAHDTVPKLVKLVGVQSVQLYSLQAQVAQLQQVAEMLEEDAEEARLEALEDDVDELGGLLEFVALPSDREEIEHALTLIQQALDSEADEEAIHEMIHPILVSLAAKKVTWSEQEAGEEFAEDLADLIEDTSPEEVEDA